MRIKSIYKYPVKSLAGIEVTSAMVEKRGLKNDRRLMFIDQNNRFVTARTHHQLGGIEVVFDQNELIFHNRFTRQELKQPVQLATEKITVGIWKSSSTCRLIENNRIDRWISDFLGEPVRLVYMAGDDFRPVNQKYGNPGEIVSFADGYPVLITNTKSLEDLNKRLETPVNMNRFRPNIVIEGEIPWEEDHWKIIGIGEVVLRIVKPCARCVVTTIDPLTGVSGEEPLRTLSLFRKKDNKVLFGMNAIAEKFGVIKTGDHIKLR